MYKFLSILVFVEVILIIWFPFIGFYSTKPYCLYGIYVLFIIAFFSNRNIVGIKRECNTNMFLKTIVLIIVGSLMAWITSRQFYSIYYDYTALIMYLVYAYTFFVVCKQEEVFNSVRLALLICGISLALYSMFSYFTETNLYTTYFSFFMNEDVMEGQYRDYSTERGISFRVYGNLNNPVFFSVELMLLLAFTSYEYLKDDVSKLYSIVLVICMALLFVGIMFTGSKSGFIPASGILLYTFYKKVSIRKLCLYIIAFSALLVIIVPTISSVLNVDISRFILAMNPFSESEAVAGSTAGHRSNQFEYLFEFMDDDFLFGRGYGWARHYTNTNGIHPILHTFESLIMSSYADGGLWGLCIVYPFFMYKLLKSNSDQTYKIVLLAYFFTMIVTGIGCFIEFLVILVYMISDRTRRCNI